MVPIAKELPHTGRSSTENQWVNEADLDCPDLVKAFFKRKACRQKFAVPVCFSALLLSHLHDNITSINAYCLIIYRVNPEEFIDSRGVSRLHT